MTPLLLDALVRSSAVLLAGLGAALLLRRRSAALQHWVLAATIAAAALAAPLAWIVPDWSVAAVPAPVLAGVRRVRERGRRAGDGCGRGAGSRLVERARSDLGDRCRDRRAVDARAAAAAVADRRARAPGRRPSLAAHGGRGRRPLRDPAPGDGPADGIRRFARDLGHAPAADLRARRRGRLERRAHSRRRLSRARARAPARLGRADGGGPGSPPLLVPTLDVDRVPASCGAKANRRATTWCWPPGSRRRRMPATCCRSPGPADRTYRWAPAVPMARPFNSRKENRRHAQHCPQSSCAFIPRRSSCLGVVLAVAMLTAAAVHTEQTRSGQLIGTIYDGSGAVLPGVEVSLSTGAGREVQGDDRRRGTFLVSQCGARPLRARSDPARLHRRAAGVRAERGRRLGPRP